MKKNSLPLMFLALTIGIFYVYLSPKYADIKLLLSERSSYDDVLAKSVELRAIREELRTKLENLSEDDIERLEKMIPQDVDPTKLILDLDNMARRYGIIMTDMTTEVINEEKDSGGESGDSSKPYQVLELGFKFSSSYGNFISFLRDVESSLRMMDVTSIMIAEDSQNPRSPNYEVKIRSYWLR